MPATFPQYVVLKSKFNNKYMEYVKEQGPVHGYVRFTGEDVASPLAKFQVQLSDGHPGLVHLLSCYSNKYLSTPSMFALWISSQADEPEDDPSKLTCTLFEPLASWEKDDYQLKHVHSDLFAGLARYGTTDNCLLAAWRQGTSNQSDVFTVIDWKSLVVLPQYVAFKGDDGNYLSAQLIDRGRHYLQFAIPDSGHVTVGHEVFRNPDGSIRLKSIHFGQFWRLSPAWIWADSDDTTNNNRDTLFWPIKIDHNTIALRSLGNNRFCKRLTAEGKTSCLNAATPTIDLHARLQVAELVESRDIFNVDFHLDRARRYNEQVVTMGTGGASNATDHEGSFTVKVARTESKSTHWRASVSLKLGVKTAFTTKVPLIAEGKIEVSTEAAASHLWDEVDDKSDTREGEYKAKVPPMTKVMVSAIGTTATCDVPFSYTQTDKYKDGRERTYRKDDGLFTGINSFNVYFDASNEDIV